jgi:hypothetical protein
MSAINKTTGNNQNWNTRRLIRLSQNLSQAYCLGSDKAKPNRKADSWTTDKFLSMSRSLSSGYGVDY